MAIGKVNVGGNGDNAVIKPLYKLSLQSTAPSTPQQGSVWVNPIKTVSKVTISLNVPTTPKDGELLLQFYNILYTFDFIDISSKIDGNINSTQYSYNLSTLANESITPNFIPLFKKDTVSEYGILKNILQYDSSISNWVVPPSYFYNGTNWVDMIYRIFTQFSDGAIQKSTISTLAVSDTITGLPNNIFQIDPDGSFYGKESLTASSFVVKKYDKFGVIISSITLGAINGYNPGNIFYVDELGYMYMVYTSSTIAGIRGGRRLLKIAPDGLTVVWTADSGSVLDGGGSPQDNKIIVFYGCGYDYMIYKLDGYSANDYLFIVNRTTGAFVKNSTIANISSTKAVFDPTSFYMVASSGGSIFEISYTGTLIRKVGTATAGLNDGASIIFKDPNVADTFYFLNTSGSGSLKKITYNFAGNTSSTAFTVTFTLPTNGISGSTRFCLDPDLNIYSMCYDTLRKYDRDGNLLLTSKGSKIYTADSLFQYNRG